MPRSPRFRAAAALFALILLALAAATPVSAAPALGFDVAAAETQMLAMVNAERTSRGLPALSPYPALAMVARARSVDMLARDYFSHTIPAGLGCADVYCQIDASGIAWSGAGENIAWNSGFPDAEATARAHAALMASPGHRANILNPNFTHLGIGVAAADATRWQGYLQSPRLFTQLFLTVPAGTTPTLGTTPTSGVFNDIAGSAFVPDIEWLAAAGITYGCGNGSFCPGAAVTRDQMASFLTRALDLPAAGADYFSDDAGNQHQAAINSLRAAGITYGCGGDHFCPDEAVTRAQMASFLARALDLPAVGINYFSDDNGSPHEADINRLRAAGITYGCGGDRFCPDGTVTREQMAAFLHRALTR